MFTFLILPVFAALLFLLTEGLSWLVAFESANGAAKQSTYGGSLKEAHNKNSEISNSGLGRLANMQKSSNVQLFVEEINLTDGVTTEYGPNKPMDRHPNLDRYIYQIEACAFQDFGPILPEISSHPDSQKIDSGIPFITAPVRIKFRVRCPAEYPEGLCEPSAG
jgi:hypothetical protein